MTEECEFCDGEFESEEELKIHWLEEHEDELNSHQKDDAKKARREKEEREKLVRERRKKYLYMGVGAAVLLMVGAVVGLQALQSMGGGGSSTTLQLKGEPMIGDPNASVTLVEFGDMQCPACNRFHQGAWRRIKSNYIESGKVKAYWKDFPLEGIHPWARTAAETMECVYRQDEEAFWNVKDTLFNNQGSITGSQDAQKKIIRWATQEGVSEKSIRSCISNGNPGSEVSEDIREGRSSGVTGTPTIFVNGERISGFSYQRVAQAIEEELGK